MAISRDDFVNAAKGMSIQCKQLIELLKGRLADLQKAADAGNIDTIRDLVHALKTDYELIVNNNQWISPQ
jgi:hypothetical protein